MEINNPQDKFTKTGQVVSNPGYTVISFANEAMDDLVAYGKQVQATFSTLPQRDQDKLALLPKSSFHITILGLFKERDQGTDKWPAFLPKTYSRQKIKQALLQRFNQVAKPQNIKMQVAGLIPQAILLEPSDVDSYHRLGNYRRQLADAFQLPLEEDYQFHMSLSYLLGEESSAIADICQQLEGECLKLEPFLLPQPDLAFYEDMLAFHPLFNTDTYSGGNHASSDY
ncbi:MULTISPECIES: DUF1868 domain-containing protein [Aerococcus]|uniref:DUF1868 domain-containing protein n=1 Tax=Aerococcus TaxID=1375 RepID=UPI000DCF09CB|nr:MULTISPECIES: DUF1868 domain-containing protein [Aerococcus]KAA9296319.1 DUF1868 domain-containing protein [Aerococcus tenax]MDK6688914.1 DUF1868 domain-containing protein [Aerococcus urinae]MDK8133789.1 DUF1868 domain-containing protein [Aerococcus urinae]MDK8485531.1 DUF1868 domain-containing protein [Aerococcus urinae]MDL5179060.1 DUF1868 domain-containing protein [Aerococcus tenax]